MEVRANSVIQGVFVEASLNPQMSVEHEEKAMGLDLQQTGLPSASQS